MTVLYASLWPTGNDVVCRAVNEETVERQLPKTTKLIELGAPVLPPQLEMPLETKLRGAHLSGPPYMHRLVLQDGGTAELLSAKSIVQAALPGWTGESLLLCFWL